MLTTSFDPRGRATLTLALTLTPSSCPSLAPLSLLPSAPCLLFLSLLSSAPLLLFCAPAHSTSAPLLLRCAPPYSTSASILLFCAPPYSTSIPHPPLLCSFPLYLSPPPPASPPLPLLPPSLLHPPRMRLPSPATPPRMRPSLHPPGCTPPFRTLLSCIQCRLGRQLVESRKVHGGCCSGAARAGPPGCAAPGVSLVPSPKTRK